MPSFYIDHRLCPVCLGARRLGGELCAGCGGTGYEPVQPYTIEPKGKPHEQATNEADDTGRQGRGVTDGRLPEGAP